MPNQKRCYLPQTGADGLPKKTKDNWDAYFVFDADKVPKGMVCKDIVPKVPKVATPSGKAAPAAIPAPTAPTPVEQAAVLTPTQDEPPKVERVDADQQGSSDTFSAVAVTETPNPSQQESAPPAGLPTMVVASVVTALAINAVMNTASAANAKGQGKGKGHHGKGKAKGTGQGNQTQQQQQQEKKREEEKKQCGVQTDAAKADADKAVQRMDAVLAHARKVEREIANQTEDLDVTTEDLDKQIAALTKRIVKLERTRLIR